jgi:hypothetical protein
MQQSHQPPAGEARSSEARSGEARSGEARSDVPVVSRRSILHGAGAGAAGLALSGLVAGPALAARPGAKATAVSAHEEAALAGETLVVHVRDVRTGEMDVYRGTSHVRVTDQSVAVALARASR